MFVVFAANSTPCTLGKMTPKTYRVHWSDGAELAKNMRSKTLLWEYFQYFMYQNTLWYFGGRKNSSLLPPMFWHVKIDAKFFEVKRRRLEEGTFKRQQGTSIWDRLWINRTSMIKHLKTWALGNAECVIWGYISPQNITSIRPTFVHHLCIDTFRRLNLDVEMAAFLNRLHLHSAILK